MDASGDHFPPSPRRCALVALLLALFVAGSNVVLFAGQPKPPPPKSAEPDYGLRDPDNPNWSTDPTDPFPMPAAWAKVRLMEQTEAYVRAKSAGCVTCHRGIGDPHQKDTVRLGCTDCHGGNAGCLAKDKAHVAPKFPELWPTPGNPARSYTLLNHEAPEFIRFKNPGDFRIAHISCGTAGCHPREVQTNRKQIMTTGAMLWGAALYNNGSVPFKRARYGEAYGTCGAPLRLKTFPVPTAEEMAQKGVVPFLEPLPRFEITQPGNILRIFEPGGRFAPEIGIPERFEEPGRPRTRLSARGLGTATRTDPVFIGLTKTRLFDPTLNFLGTNDHPGDYHSSGCTTCHVIYANDRSAVHSGPYAKYGNRGTNFSPDPMIPKDVPGHPIDHKFTSAIPTSQCISCHIHPGTTVLNSYIGYMWYDEESEARALYPVRQKNLTNDELHTALVRNPNEVAARSHLANPQFVADLARFNPHMSRTHFGDFHSHGWAFRAVFKKDREGNLIDHDGAPVGPPEPQQFAAAVDFPNRARKFHQDEENNRLFRDPDTGPGRVVAAEQKLNESRKGTPVHLLDIHMEKGMHCVDCHFSQDNHGNNRLHMEVRAAVEIQCTDCHGTSEKYATLRTTGPASYTSSPEGGRNLAAMKTPFGVQRFEVQDLGDGTRRVFQNSMVEKGLRWEVVQTRDTVRPGHARYNARSALAKTVRFDTETGQMTWGDLPAAGERGCAHRNDNMSCIACHTSWNPSCYGCHLHQRANLKMPTLHAEGDVSRNYTAYNFQTLRDDIYMLARDGDVTGNKIGPARSSCAVHVSSSNINRESIYLLQQTISAEGFAGTAFSTNVPHTVRGRGARETKQCTDCHVSKTNDNNAWMGQLLMHGSGYLNLIGKYAWVAAGSEGLFGVTVSEAAEPQAVIGSDLHHYAYPDNFKQHALRDGRLTEAYHHSGRDIGNRMAAPFKKPNVLMLQNRGEYLYAACGEDGVRLFDIAFIDDKAFAQRATSAPVSPLGQRFCLPTKYATFVAAPATVAVDPTRSHRPENREQAVHALFGYLYIADKHEGLILTGAGPVIDGNPVNNFLKRDLTFNPNNLLCGANYISIVGHYAYITCDAGLVVLDIDKPTKPVVTAVIGKEFLKAPRNVSVQFRYAFVCDAEGVKILDVTDLAKPAPKAHIKLKDARGLYLARTYAYVAAGCEGLLVFDIRNPEDPKLDQAFTANGCINDAEDVKLGITYTSQFAYIADGKNGMRVVQLVAPETPGYEGFSPRPTPKLVATFPVPKGGRALAVARGLDRDRAVDETGNQLGVFGRVGARPLNAPEQKKMYLRGEKPWVVSDDPNDPMYLLVRKKPPLPRRRRKRPGLSAARSRS
jgi:hypothetical protein